MPLHVVCPSCGTSYDLPKSQAGKRVRCNHCATAFVANQAADDDDVDDVEVVDEPPARKPVKVKAGAGKKPSRSDDDDDDDDDRPRRRKSNDQTPLIIGLFGGGVVLLAIAGGLWFMMRGRAQPVPPVAQPMQPMQAGPVAAGGPGVVPQQPFQPNLQPAPAQPAVKPPDAGPKAVWTVAVDPAPATGQPFDPAKLVIPVEPGHEVLFPTAPSPFAAVGRNLLDKDARTLYDLRTGARAGGLSGKLGGFFKSAVSPDGELFAAVPSASLKTVDVWSFKTGQGVSRIDVQNKHGFIDLMDFAGPGEVVTVCSGEQFKKVVRVWSATTGQKLREIQGTAAIYSQEYALSPGRRYLALFADKALHVFDLKEGAESQLDVLGNTFGVCQAIAFSPDGTLVAVSLLAGARGRVLAADVATGTVVADHSFPQPLNVMVPNAFHQGSHLEWLPDNSGWLVQGDTIIDRKSAQPRFSVAGAGFKSAGGPTKVVSNGTLLAVVGQGFKTALTAIPFGKAAGGSAPGGTEPAAAAARPPTPADWSAARGLTPGAGATAALRPDPLPAAKGPFAMPVDLSAGGKPLPPAGPIRVLFARADAGQVVTVSANPTPNKFVPHSWRADRYDLVTGKRLGGIDAITQAPQTAIAVPFGFAEVSPDGTRLLVRDAQTDARLDLWSLEDGKALAGWLPYEKDAAARVTWAGFVDAARAWTMSDGGKLGLWEVPGCKAVAALDATPHTTPSLSPGGAYLAVATGNGLDILDAKTGEPRGRLGFPAGISTLLGLAVAWRPDGKELAAVAQSADSRSVIVRWDLGTGMTADRFSLKGKFEVTAAKYCGDGHLLLNGTDLLDFAGKAVYIRYQPTGVTAPTSPDARTWFGSRGPGGPVLAAKLLPDEQGKKLAAQLQGATAVIQPGAAVAVQVQANGTVADLAGVQKRITDAVALRLKSVGLEPAAAGDLRLALDFRERDTGETFELKGFGANRATYNVPIKKLAYTATLTDSSGAVLWQDKGEQTTRAFFGLRRFTEEPAVALLKELWAVAPVWSAGLNLPGQAVRLGKRTVYLPVPTPLAGE